MKYHFSNHAVYRQCTRNLSLAEIEYVIQHGHTVRSAGALKHILPKKDIPACDRAKQRPAQFEGTTVLVNEKEAVILTVFRNKAAFRNESKKSKRNKFKRAA